MAEVESSVPEIKGLQLTKAIELHVSEDKREKPVIIMFVPYHLLKTLHNNAKKLYIELEKKLRATVLLVVSRTIQSRWIKVLCWITQLRKSQKRPHSRTLTAVHEAILDDLVLPSSIVGKRQRVRLDGSSYLKVSLDKVDAHLMEGRVNAIKAAYKLLTNKVIEIDFASDPTYYTLKQIKPQNWTYLNSIDCCMDGLLD
jgi:small subunit ribosomal protein S7e